jgi:hypothetical protein
MHRIASLIPVLLLSTFVLAPGCDSPEDLDAEDLVDTDGEEVEITPRSIHDPLFTMRLRVAHSGKCLDVPLPYAIFSRMQQFTCNSGSNQKWDFVDSPGQGDALVSAHTDTCLTATWDPLSGAGVTELLGCGGAANQRWVWEPNGRIRNVGTNRCLDVANASQSNGAFANHFPCHAGANQVWSAF